MPTLGLPAYLTQLGGAPEALTASRLGQTGIWTWFTDPRAVVHDGVLYTGWLAPGVSSSDADATVSSYRLSDGDYTETVAFANVQNDDHANPALWVHPDTGKIRVFWGQHNDGSIKWKDSTNAEDISAFDAQESIATGYASYCNPHYLSSEGRLYYMFRMDVGAPGWRPGIVYSDDPTATTPTWSTQRWLFDSGVSDRPYWAYTSNGTNRIDFVFSAGHPAGVSGGSGHIYHFYLTGGSFYKTDGTLIRALSTLATTGAITNLEATKVYDATTNKGTATNGNAWPWGVELDPLTGRPVIVYSVYSAVDDNRYHYAKWNGSAWVRTEIASGQGSLFGAGATAENQYVGGLCIDPRNTDRLYVSKQVSATQWDLERWTTSDSGSTFATKESIHSTSAIKCFRPFCPRGWVTGAPAVVFCRGLYTVSNGPSPSVDIYASPAVTPV